MSSILEPIQESLPAGLSFTQKELPNIPSLTSFVEFLCDNNFHWPDSLKRFDLPKLKSGQAFEVFVGNLISLMNPSDLLYSLELVNSSQKGVWEVDLISRSQGGKTVLIDLKMRDAKDKKAGSPLAQIKKAAAVRTIPGFENISILLVRPRLTFNPSARKLMEYLGIDCLDQSNLEYWVTQLSTKLGLDFTPELGQVEEIFNRRYYRLSKRKALHCYWGPNLKREEPWINSENTLYRDSQDKKRNWSLSQIHRDQFLMRVYERSEFVTTNNFKSRELLKYCEDSEILNSVIQKNYTDLTLRVGHKSKNAFRNNTTNYSRLNFQLSKSDLANSEANESLSGKIESFDLMQQMGRVSYKLGAQEYSLVFHSKDLATEGIPFTGSPVKFEVSIANRNIVATKIRLQES